MIQAPETRSEAPDVPLSDIESVLARMWRDADAAMLAAGGQTLARNSVMTLVVYVHGERQANYAAHAIESLTGQHPSRSIILAVDPATPKGPVAATVSTHSHASQHGGGHVRSEQIIIHISTGDEHHIPGIILPLLLTEMPAFIWWTGDLPAGDIVNNLIDACDRAIFDSSDFQQPEQSLVRIADLVAAHRRTSVNRTAFSDFNWSRLRSWRELTAQFFDSQALYPCLGGLDRIDIKYALNPDDAPNPTQAFLYAGWLASRLRWQTFTKHRSGGAVRLGLNTHTGAPITIEITPRLVSNTLDWWASSSAEWPVQLGGELANDEDLEAPSGPDLSSHNVSVGALLRVELHARMSDSMAVFTIAREEDLKNATTMVMIDGALQQQRIAALDPLGETALLHQQLAIFDHDSVFEDTILAARDMMAPESLKIGRGMK